ncbi:biotin--[acetyl-CoA-carboxylase] ligase [Limosilactobacillus gastricus]|uniref:biotin--[acetyl-CoA-carboxylase] ligase n=1 Tax=Limosilactobacillus gastricus TaxID=227942 RepID=UPI0026EF9B0A|nr:biotin--[acetyl-CoA-carboxylase] ligase [Limosilactobacillus gastricus]
MLKDEILAALIDHQSWLNGNELASQLGVTRAGVSKAIQQLKASGYQIAVDHAKGYRFVGTRHLSQQLIQRQMGSSDMWKLEVWDEVTSTQDRAKEIIANESDDRFIAVIANQQTAGHGRLGRKFYSPAQTGLYFSVVIPHQPIEQITKAGLLTTSVAVVISEELERLIPGLRLQVKWVNDLYLGQQKIAGILTEAVLDVDNPQWGSIIVGIGINLSTTKFPAELHDQVASLQVVDFDRNQFLANFLNRFSNLNATYSSGCYLPAYRQRQLLIGRQVTLVCGSEQVTGLVDGIDDQGALVLKVADQKLRSFDSGEVTKVKW